MRDRSPIQDRNPNAAPSAEAIKRNVLGTDVQGAGQFLPNGGSIWAPAKAGDTIEQRVLTIQGDTLVLIFSGADKVKICAMLGIQLPGVQV